MRRTPLAGASARAAPERPRSPNWRQRRATPAGHGRDQATRRGHGLLWRNGAGNGAGNGVSEAVRYAEGCCADFYDGPPRILRGAQRVDGDRLANRPLPSHRRPRCRRHGRGVVRRTTRAAGPPRARSQIETTLADRLAHGPQGLYLRSMGDVEARLLRATEEPRASPFFPEDGPVPAGRRATTRQHQHGRRARPPVRTGGIDAAVAWGRAAPVRRRSFRAAHSVSARPVEREG